MSKEADGKEHVAQKTDLIEHMRETLSSPELFATLSGVDRVIRDPISLVGLESTSDQKPEVVNGDGGLGHREEDVNIPQERSSGSSPEQKDAQPFGPQEQGVTQKDALPGGTQEQGARRDGGDGLQVPVYQAVLPVKRSLAMLSSELTDNKHRLHQGLHPNPFGVAGLTGVGRGAEQGRGLGILGGAGLLPGWQGPSSKKSPDFQQVMSPNCEKYLSAFGTSSASSSQVTVKEKASKRYKEGPIDEGKQKVNLLDLKKKSRRKSQRRSRPSTGTTSINSMRRPRWKLTVTKGCWRR